jgi:hypothetical protein
MLTGLNPDAVAGTKPLDGPVRATDQRHARENFERLPEGMRVPGGTRRRTERDAVGTQPSRMPGFDDPL